MKQTQRGSLIRSYGSYHVRYRDTEIGPDGEPKKVLRSHRLCDAKLKRAEAMELKNEYMSQRVGNISADVPSWKLVDFIIDEYLPRCKTRLAASTYIGYAAKFNLHGIPALDHNMRLRDFTVYEGMMLMKKISARSNLSRQTLKHIKNFFTGVFTHALRLGAIAHENPMRYVEVPKGGHETGETYAYSPQEIEAMLAVLPEPANTAVLLAASTGLRRSELRGLIWDDWQGDTLSVRRAIWLTHVKETKGKSSKAPIPVSAELEARLRAFRPTNAEGTDYILVGPRGKSIELANMATRVIKPALRRCVICHLAEQDHAKVVLHAFVLDETLPKWSGWHGFRRGLATYLHHRGVGDLVIQRILRHSTVDVTRKCYIKTLAEDTREAMRQLDGAFNSKGAA